MFEAQVDYLTCSIQNSTKSATFLGHSQKLLDLERAHNKVIPFYLHGYIGQHSGRVSWGKTESGVLVQLSGDLAAQELDWYAAHWSHCSRIDIAVTVRVEPTDVDVARRAKLALPAKLEGRPGRKLSWRYEDASDGNTLYLGKRDSQLYQRLYDKSREDTAERYRNAWRYECECKEALAGIVALACVRAPDRHAFCQDYVHTSFTRRGVDPVFPADGLRLLSPGYRSRADCDRKLSYLARTIRPMMAFLQERGYDDLALQAIDPTAPIPYRCPTCGDYRCDGHSNTGLTA